MSRTRIVKGIYDKITHGNYNIFSRENINSFAGENFDEKGVEEGLGLGDPENAPPPESLAKVAVEFRPHSNYDGEFGFDWVRTGDTGMSRDVPYEDIVGKYYQDESFSVLANHEFTDGGTGFFRKDISEYKKLLMEYRPSFGVSWRKHAPIYYPSYLTLLAGNTARLSLLVAKVKTPEKLEFKFDQKLFAINQINIPVDSTTLNDWLEIKCLESFSTNQKIEVIATSKSGVKTVAGRIVLIANASEKINTISLRLIGVKTSGLADDSFSFQYGDFLGYVGRMKLDQIFSQFLIKAEYKTGYLDVSKNPYTNPTSAIGLLKESFFDKRKDKHVLSLNKIGTDDKGQKYINPEKRLFDFLDEKMKEDFPEDNTDLKWWFNVFCFDVTHIGVPSVLNELTGEIGYNLIYGIADSGGFGNSIILNKEGSKNPVVVAHEVLHMLNLEHVFSNENKFTFLMTETDNIEDYYSLGTMSGLKTSSIYQWKEVNRMINY